MPRTINFCCNIRRRMTIVKILISSTFLSLLVWFVLYHVPTPKTIARKQGNSGRYSSTVYPSLELEENQGRGRDIYVNVSETYNPMLNGTKEKLREAIVHSLREPWRKNYNNMKNIRRQLSRNCSIKNMFTLNQENIKVGQRVKPSFYGKQVTITKDRYKDFATSELFAIKNFNTCSVVGSSGILNGSGCGRQIDLADAVFRFNVPLKEPFLKDAGNKTTINTLNQSTYKARYGNLNSTENKAKFIREMREAVQDGFLWMPDYSMPGQSKTTKIGNALLIKEGFNLLFMHPHHFRFVRNTWQPWGIRGHISSGFYFISVAIELCDKVQVYGFWPFKTGPDNKTASYHYYNKQTSNFHDFSHEFLMLCELHKLGVLKLIIDPCTYP